MSDSNENITRKPVSRRSVIKWTGALAATGVVGIGLGLGADLLLRPNTTKTVEQVNTSTETQTATATVTQPTTITTATTATTTATKTATTTATTTETINNNQTANPLGPETITYTAKRTGPLAVHTVGGRWVRSSVLQPNIYTAWRLLGERNRAYGPERVRYPMMRVGWAPGGKSSTANRGTGQFVRITWAQAYAYIASEMQRVYNTYGPSAAYASTSGHQWPGQVQKGETWTANLLKAMGGYTVKSGGESFTGWNDTSYMIWGTGMPAANSFTDLVANCKMIIYWGVDHSGKGWVSWESNPVLRRYKAAGVKLVVIDPWFNETAAMNADKYISITPHTDEALLAAIAYVWIQAGTFNQAWLNTHTIGFDETHLPKGAPAGSSFSNYILGLSDGVPKTPAWASAITGVPANDITALAQEWASKNTYVDSYSGGAQRRLNAGAYVRMLVTVCSMQGLGMSGRGLGWAMWASAGGNGGTSNPVAAIGGAFTSPTNPVTQLLHHVNFPEAVLTNGSPAITWTTGHYATTGGPAKLTYPLAGNSPIHMIYGCSGSDMTQRPGGSDNYSQAYQSPNLEFICFQAMEWVGGTLFADIVLPVTYVQENEDLIAWHNYVVYNAPAIAPMYEAKSDMQIVYDLANMLGVMSKLAPGRTGVMETDLQYWLANGFANITPAISTAVNAQPTTYAAFKQQGFIYFPTPDYALTPQGGLAAFNLNPTTSPLNTPSGLIEIYSTQVVGLWGTSDPVATPVPHYIPSPENRLAAPATSGQYPLEHMTIHSFFSEHEQWHHMSWARDDPITFQNGYTTLWMNTDDAAARGIKTGDAVKVYNGRGQTLYGAYVTERCKPGLVIGMDGGNWKPITPGKVGSLNMGGAANMLTPQVQADVTCDGMATSGLVQAEKWNGTGS